MKTLLLITISTLSISSFALTEGDKDKLNQCFGKLTVIESIFNQDLDLWQSVQFAEEANEMANDYANICNRYLELSKKVKQ